MPEKITGIDIGERHIKSVSVSAGLKGYHIIDALVVNIAEAGGIKPAVEQIFRKAGFHGSAVITALPFKQCSFRMVRLPFTDRKKIRQTLPYELEQSIPFPIDAAVVDYLTVDRTGKADLLAGAVPRNIVDERVDILNSSASEIAAIDAGSVPVAALFAADRPEESSIILDIGAKQTECIFILKGRISHIRAFGFGGDRITETIARVCGVDFAEAERMKLAGEIEKCREEIDGLIESFSGQIKETLDLLAFRGDLDTQFPCMHITGGGALFIPLRKGIESFLKIPAYEIDIVQSGAVQFRETARKPWEPLVMNQALALAIRESKGNAGFNFLPEGADSGGVMEKYRREIKWAGAVAAVICILLFVNFYLDYRYDQRQLGDLRREIREVFTTAVPDVTRIVDPVHQMKTKIAETKKAGTGRAMVAGETKVLSVLRDMSRLVPQSVVFLITSFTYDEDSIRIKGETDNFNTVDAIKSALEKGRTFQSVTISSAKLMKTGGRVSFDLKMEPVL
ncbi:MAG: pilus assembly protein PilM [Syntrophales bacterium]|jgi:Tfp pilus assembly PilM family ATPase/Tfp pilus assembly protein PilN|nr:pilus assembly protein PilM [Syntrophales bacterium]MDY0044339.1 pilus assembly protein PilM [Syntrophales bacterium]